MLQRIVCHFFRQLLYKAPNFCSFFSVTIGTKVSSANLQECVTYRNWWIAWRKEARKQWKLNAVTKQRIGVIHCRPCKSFRWISVEFHVRLSAKCWIVIHVFSTELAGDPRSTAGFSGTTMKCIAKSGHIRHRTLNFTIRLQATKRNANVCDFSFEFLEYNKLFTFLDY
jgi:hypothetical protein